MKRITYQLAVPVVLLILSVLLIWQWAGLASYMSKEKELHALLTILPTLPYLLFSVLVVMGWRYNNAGLIFSSLILGLCYFVFALYPEVFRSTPLVEVAAFLLPLNLVFSSFNAKRRIFTPFGGIWAGVIVLQIILVLFICAPVQYQEGSFWLWLSKSMSGVAVTHKAIAKKIVYLLTGKSIALVYLLAFIFLGYRFFRTFDIALTGYMGTLVAVLLGLLADNSVSGLMICFSTAGIIMLITTIEASFSMAYLDELTGLPGRRSLNELMLNLGKTYTIAMLDIDHFKKFNDKYGHKTGDDVLKMVATIFSKIRGNAKTFRYGGEEFTAVFPGKTAEEAQPYLEKIRRDIADAGFVVRSKTRKKKTEKDRGDKNGETRKTVNVTISIGAATNTKEHDTPEKVIKAADAILYKAKKAGRNRVKIG